MKRLAAAILVAYGALASEAGAAWRIGLMALSHHGDRAVIAYGADWAEIELASRRMTLLPKPEGCDWTSASYAADGSGAFALTVACAADGSCAALRAELWTGDATDGDPNLARLASGRGVRWGAAYWRSAGVLVTETPVFAPRARGLNDLGRSEDCRNGPPRFAAIAPGVGRAAALDYAPEGWSAVRVVAADGRRLLAAFRMRRGEGVEYAAEAELREICDRVAAGEIDGRSGACASRGAELVAEWSGGDWRLATGPEAAAGRRVASSDLSVTGREVCFGANVNGRLKTSCVARLAGPSGPVDIEAPAGLFGDLILSGGGRVLAALVAGRGLRVRRFDLFDAATGEARDVSDILDLEPPADGATGGDR